MTEPWDAYVAGYTLFLGVSVRGFLEKIGFWIGGLSKADGPPQCGKASLNPLKNASFSLCLINWAGASIFFCLWCSKFSGLQNQTVCHWLFGSQAFKLCHWWVFPGLKLADNRLWNLSVSIIVRTFYNKSQYLIGSVSWENPD